MDGWLVAVFAVSWLHRRGRRLAVCGDPSMTPIYKLCLKSIFET
jgi:hypothetical protein